MKTLRDVAILAGVSEGTASLALNNRKGVNAETRKRVLEAARKIGYTPNRVARGLAMKRTNTIGFVVTEIENPFFSALARHIHQSVRGAGYKLMMSISNEDAAQEDEILSDFLEERVEAVIIVPTLAQRASFEMYEKLQSHEIPCVFATAYYPGFDSNIDCVMTDLENGSYQLTKYLLDLNHTNILFATAADVEAVPSRDRIRGFERAMLETHNAADREVTVQTTRADFQGGYSVGRRLAQNGLPDAVAAVNDIMALGISSAVRECGYGVPEDISICGYDDVVFSSIAEVPLTTVRQDVELIAREAVRLAIERMSGADYPYEIIKLRPDLVVRRSTGPRQQPGTERAP